MNLFESSCAGSAAVLTASHGFARYHSGFVGFQAPSPLQRVLWWGLGLGLCSRQVLLEPTLRGSELRDSLHTATQVW